MSTSDDDNDNGERPGRSPSDRTQSVVWACPNCDDDGPPERLLSLAVYRCPECGVMVPVDEVGL